MIEPFPITLTGDNLGKRHHCLNTLVNKTFEENEPLQSLLDQPEATPLDRIFKIELASKHRDVDYIIKNLKDTDMLFVSKALKCQWMLESKYSYIINPLYLEGKLYPMMTTTAVNKMKNMIELNLKDPQRCQEFFEFHKNNFDTAIKYLWHCSKEFIIEQVSNVIDKLSSKHLRILCESCPQVAKIYFDGLQNNAPALKRYLNSKLDYQKSVMSVLKNDSEIFFYLIEKYFDNVSLSPSTTRHIMKTHKDRYINKPELYAGWLLNMETLALFLSNEEIKDIVVRLARAQYLNYSLSYKHVEPLLTRLNGEDRAAIKKMIFVDKSFGDSIASWPYPPPQGLTLIESNCKPLKDKRHHPYEYEYLEYESDHFKILKKRKIKKKCGRWECAIYSEPNKSSLDALFDRYRFVNFDRVFFEFRKLLMTESTIEGRRNMILVLVSKAGGNEAKVKQLLKFLVERHSNEPDHLRDAVARSMVKRAFAWRLPSDTWELLLKWATTSVREILHSNIIRVVLAGSPCPPDVLAAYLEDFSDLSEYSLNADEKRIVKKRLPEILVAANAPNLLLDTLIANKVRIDSVPGAVNMLIIAARKDKNLLRRVFELKVARRYLLQESFDMIQTDVSYLNALKHDVSVLKNGESLATFLANNKPNHDRFLRALALYFTEHDGLAARHFEVLEKASQEEYRVSFARPIAYLVHAGNKSFTEYLTKVDTNSIDEKRRTKFAAALRANASVVRPLLDVDTVDWHKMGGKFISNKVIVCSDRDLENYIQKCLQWRKMTRIVLQLAGRNNSVPEILANVMKKRPTVAVKFFLAELRKGVGDVNLWNQIKMVILNLDLSKKPLQYVKRNLAEAKPMQIIKADYWTCVFEALRKVSELEAMPMLCRIENLLTQVDENSLDKIIKEFLEEKLTKDLLHKENYPRSCICLNFRIIAKYLLTSLSSEHQQNKIKTICDPFFDKLERIFKELDNKARAIECLNDFLLSLKYTEAFLNSKYVSCTPMFERIIERLPKVLPRERYFKNYVYIHLTMLYYRSITQVMKQRPEIVADKQLLLSEHVQSLGFVLGKYISKEIQDLIENYFESVVEIYQRTLLNFFHSFEYNDSREKLVDSVIRGLIQGQSDSLLLAQFVFEKASCKKSDEILKLLENGGNEETNFFLHAGINPY